jgi:signal peptidase II
MPPRWKIFLLVALMTLAADQASKIWARHELPAEHARALQTSPCAIPDDFSRAPSDPLRCHGVAVSIIANYWDWRLSFNPGSAFGMFHSQSGARVFLSIVGIIAVGVMFWMVRKARDHQRALLWALGLVAGGAIGNLVDRIYFGVVTDFVLWRYHSTEWPVFNIADVALVVGVGLMFFDVGKEPKSPPKPATATP